MTKATLLIINGSYREGSLSGIFSSNLVKLAETEFEVKRISVRDLDLPNFDFSRSGLDQANTFRHLVQSSDGIFAVSPEYHGCISGSLKNALDYLEDDCIGKPVAAFSASGEPKSGLNAINTLRLIFRSLQAHLLVGQVHLSVDEFRDGKVLSGDGLDRCRSVVKEMKNAVLKDRLYLQAQSKNKQMSELQEQI